MNFLKILYVQQDLNLLVVFEKAFQSLALI
jgi:hypothetical protein